MNNNQILANRFREVLLNGTWVANTNFKTQLLGLNWQIATKKVTDLNTIADLSQHIHYYISGINSVFQGGTLDIKDKFSFDFEPILSQQDWEAFLSRFWNDAEKFAVSVENLTEEQLNHFFSEEKYGTYFRNIDAMIEHSYYHLGQIVMLKKIINQE
jgi:hypothetical protein